MPLADKGMKGLNGLLTDEDLIGLQKTTILYYLHESNPANGLVRDKTDPAAPCSIAAVGLALSTIPALVEHGVISREFAPEIALRKLRFFHNSPHGAGNNPSCCMSARLSIRFHVCTMRPASSNRCRSQNVVTTCLPVGGRPMTAVVCVAVARERPITQSSSATT